jgi:acyl-homoserine-lactone acylase
MMQRISGRGLRCGVALTIVGALAASACSNDSAAPTATTAPPSQAPSTTPAPADTAPDSTDPSTVSSTTAPGDTYRATITRTEHGIPHIVADDLGSVMFGQGYAFAEDRACTVLDQVLKVRSERSAWFGPGENDSNLTSDFAYLHLGLRGRAEAYWADDAPDLVRDAVSGWLTGFNRAVADLGVDALPGWCAGTDWAAAVGEISEIDLLMYLNDLMLLASSANFLDGIGTAQPPNAVTSGAVDAAMPTIDSGGLASNGWAIGSELSSTGGGLLLSNPHFPWEGELRLWESHLTVPGEMDVYGVGLSGVPGILIGFTEQFGWTHTVSAGDRFTAYRLTLAPGDPTTYVYDDTTRPMTATTHTIEVLQDDGSTSTVERTLWASHYGPIITLGPLGWDDASAFTARDANIDNLEAIEQFLLMNTADDFDAFQLAHEEVNGIPWVNTMAVSADGRAWYADTAATPNLSDEAIAGWEEARTSDPIVALAFDSGAVLLDGSSSVNEWVEVDGARDPGLVPFADQPQLERSDYIFNANNSYWLANPAAPLEGFSPLHGGERLPPGGRPRMNDITIREGSGDDGLYTGDEVRDALLSSRSITGDQWADAVVERCAAGGRTDLAAACDVIAAWDRTYRTDSVGAVLWSAMLDEILEANDVPVFAEGPLWAVPWSVDDPIDTPQGLADDDATTTIVLDALALAVDGLAAAGIPLDAPLGDVQVDARIGGSAPVPGTGWDDSPNIATCCGTRSSLLAPASDVEYDSYRTYNADGTMPIIYGASFVMALEYGPDGPSAQAVLTYGQPDDPADPDFSSQTEVWGAMGMRPIHFTAEGVAANAVGSPVTVEGERAE